MRIALLSDSKTGINILPQVEEKLAAQIADAEIRTYFVSAPSDLPLKAKELASSNGLVFVFSLYTEEEKSGAEMVLKKLMDVEVETGKKIVKAVGESELDDVSTQEGFEEERDRLAEKWAEVIVKSLFKPEEFAPKEEERGEFPTL